MGFDEGVNLPIRGRSAQQSEDRKEQNMSQGVALALPSAMIFDLEQETLQHRSPPVSISSCKRLPQKATYRYLSVRTEHPWGHEGLAGSFHHPAGDGQVFTEISRIVH